MDIWGRRLFNFEGSSSLSMKSNGDVVVHIYVY